jgi:glycosyltransferase involved in cell wall biosynthesis
MKILHAVHNYPPEFRGGIERVVEALSAAQAAGGHDVTVLSGSETAADDATARHERHQGIPVVRVVRGRGLHDAIDPFRADVARLIEEALVSVRPDVIHVHHWFNLGTDLVRRAARLGIPAVVTLHDFYTTCGLFFRLPDGAKSCDLEQSEANCVPCIGARGPLDADEMRFRVKTRREAFHAELRCAAAVTAPSESHAAALRTFLPPGISILPVPPGSPAAEPVAAARGDGPLRILHFGNLCRVKGVEFLTRAVAAADPSGRMVELVLAGPMVEAGLETGGASLAGAFDPDRLRALAAEADVAAFPSFARESYSLVVDEALRLGLPVLVSDRGALSERIGGRGIALPAGDLPAWTGAIAGLAKDRTALERMRASPHRPLATPEQHAGRMLALYAAARVPPGAPTGVEGALLDRLAHYDGRIRDILDLLSNRKGAE